MPFYYRIALITICTLLFACARVVSPTGGEKDLLAPKLLASAPGHLSTNFTGQTIYLSFDEYIVLDNPTQNVVIAPLPKNRPIFSVKGQRISIEFEEPLLENTTYSIFFGDAIKDNNEGNVLSNFSLVFSTGNVLDSLEIKGKVKDAATDLPLEGIKILAYTNTNDSIVLSQKPNYISISKADGSYSFKYLPSDYFRIFALVDKNGNLSKDLPNETFDYSTDSIKSDTIAIVPTLRIWEEVAELQRKKNKAYKGNVLAVNFNKNAEFEEKEYLYKGEKLNYLSGKSFSDSVLIAFTEGDFNDSIINPTTEDTLLVNFSNRDKDFPALWSIAPNKLIWDSLYLKSNINFTLSDSFNLYIKCDSTLLTYNANEALQKVDDKTFALKQSILDSANNGIIYIKKSVLVGQFPLEYCSNDSIGFTAIQKDSSAYGRVSILIDNPEKLSGYVSLKDENEEIIRAEVKATDTQIKLKSPILLPTKYNLLFVKDDNNNGVWDAGKYTPDEKYKAERTIAYQGDLKIRANWILDLSWSLSLSEE